MSDTMILAPVAGWYDDPINDATWRWWDGANWTNQARSKDIPLVSMVPTHAPPKYFDEQRGDGALVAQPVLVPPTPTEHAPTMFLEPEPELEPVDAGEPELIVYDDEPAGPSFDDLVSEAAAHVVDAPAAPAAPAASEYEPPATPEYEAAPATPEHALQPEPGFVPELAAAAEPAYSAQPPMFEPEPVYAAQPPAYEPEPTYAAQPPAFDLSDQSTPAASPQRFGQLFADDPVVSVHVTPETATPSSSISSSTELEIAGREPDAPVYPWDAAIAALAADNARFEAASAASGSVAAVSAPVAPAPSRRTLRGASAPVSAGASSTSTPSTSTTVAVIPRGPAAAPATGAPESANTPWIWILAFGFYIWAAVAGVVQGVVLPMLATSGMDAATLQLIGLAALVVGLVPLWVLASLDRSALARRGLEGPSVLWMLLLPPIGYFVARGRKLAGQNARSRGPRLVLLVVTVIQVAAIAFGVFVAVTMVGALTSLTGVALPF